MTAPTTSPAPDTTPSVDTGRSITNADLALLKNCPLLKEDTFHEWRKYMEMFFTSVGADQILDMLDELDKAMDTTQREAVLTKYDAASPTSRTLDRQLSPHIFVKTDPSYHGLYDGLRSGMRCYIAAIRKFQRSTMARRFQAREAFVSVKQKKKESVEDYVKRILDARKVLKGLGVEPDELETKDTVLMGLNKHYRSTRTTILAATVEPNLTTIISILSSAVPDSAQNGDSDSSDDEGSASGLAAATGRTGRSSRPGRGEARGKGKERARSFSPPTSDGFRWCDPTHDSHCHRCGRKGHIAAYCIHDMPQKVKQWVMRRPTVYVSESANAARRHRSRSYSPASSDSSTSSDDGDARVNFLDDPEDIYAWAASDTGLGTAATRHHYKKIIA